MTPQVRYLSSLVLYLLCLCFLARSSQANCLAKFLDFRDGRKLVTGGNPMDIANATGMTYGLCRFRWVVTILRRKKKIDESAVLGSFLFSPSYHIFHSMAIADLQQVPLKVNVEEALLSSLVVLPENDQWWSEFILWLDVNNIYTFSFVNLASIGWVIIAFALTVIDTFTNVVNNSAPPLNSNGLTVAFAWLWLLPVIISWLQVGSRCDSRTLHRAFQHANRNVYAATINARSVPADLVSTSHAISVARFPHSPRTNEHSPSPVNNYARIFSWTLAVDRAYVVFREASRRAEQRIPVNPISAWVKGDRDIRIHPENRRGSVDQVAAYTGDTYEQNSTDCIHSAVFRIVVSAFLALILTWGTIGAAMLTQWFTPTRGRLIQSIYRRKFISTLVWMLLVISSILTSTGVKYESQARKRSTLDVCTALRRMGETLAAINAAWIVLACIFQFIGLYDTCWCTSSAFSLGSRAYSVAILTRVEISELWPAVIGGTILACGSVLLFFGAVNILLDTHVPL
ncbi:hypothetical protein C8J57DRAFT_1226066 [Mycena rebaudengoi]|nr:hypothetical protein C8J57DRAFT_1226066 [Mycena rebaudengoi]